MSLSKFIAGSALALTLWAFAILVGQVFPASRNRDEDASRAGTSLAGDQLMMVVLGSSTCGASQIAGFGAALSDIHGWLEAYARQEERELRSVGIALDPSVGAGLEFLRQYSEDLAWSEISVGGGWANESVRRWIWDVSAAPSVPQVIIALRTTVAGPDVVSFETEEVVLRMIGGEGILSWERTLPLALERLTAATN